MTAPPVTFHKHNPKLVEVKHHGNHAGWLDRHTGKKDGMTGPRSRYYYWSGIVRGNDIRDISLTGAKAKAIKALTPTPTTLHGSGTYGWAVNQFGGLVKCK